MAPCTKCVLFYINYNSLWWKWHLYSCYYNIDLQTLPSHTHTCVHAGRCVAAADLPAWATQHTTQVTKLKRNLCTYSNATSPLCSCFLSAFACKTTSTVQFQAASRLAPVTVAALFWLCPRRSQARPAGGAVGARNVRCNWLTDLSSQTASPVNRRSPCCRVLRPTKRWPWPAPPLPWWH